MLSSGIWFWVENKKKKETQENEKERKKERKKTETHPKTNFNGRNNKKFYQTINGHLNVHGFNLILSNVLSLFSNLKLDFYLSGEKFYKER